MHTIARLSSLKQEQNTAPLTTYPKNAQLLLKSLLRHLGAKAALRASMLDQLPVELQQRIISVADFPSLLSLSLTCRLLHGACQNAVVLKNVIKNRNGYCGPVWRYPDFFEESSTSDLARYALADALASRDGTKWAYSMVDVNQGDLHCLPTLTALNREYAPIMQHLDNPDQPDPFIDSLDVRLFHSLLYHIDKSSMGDNICSNRGYGQSFCMAARLMSTVPPNDLPLDSSQFHQSGSSGTDSFRKDGKHPRYDTPIRRHLQPCYGQNPFHHQTETALGTKGLLLDIHVRANVEVGIIALTLREILINAGCGPTPAAGVYVHPFYFPITTASQLPTWQDIPFHTFMQLPKMFGPDAARDFALCHLAKMTTSEFLADGEWRGFYSVPSSTARYDPPMHGIRFSARDPSPAGTVELIAMDGRDRVGAFSLVGTVSKSSGWVALRKEYRTMTGTAGPLPSWNWYGVMTPFGIVCKWGTPSWGGWVWLWKAKWTEGKK